MLSRSEVKWCFEAQLQAQRGWIRRVLSSKITSNKPTDELILLISDRSMLQSFLADLGFSKKQSTEFFEDYHIKILHPEVPEEKCLVM